MPPKLLKPKKQQPEQQHPLEIEVVDIDSVVPHPRNVRVHPEDNIQAIMKSLTTFGQMKPIVVDSEGQVIAGNGTLESAKRLKWTQIQIVRVNLPPAEAEAFAIADNKTCDLSEFDYQKLATVMREIESQGIDLDTTGFQSFEREPLLQAEWNPGEAGDMPTDEPGTHTVKFTDEQWQLVQEAINAAKEQLSEHYDTESDAAAIAAYCYQSVITELKE